MSCVVASSDRLARSSIPDTISTVAPVSIFGKAMSAAHVVRNLLGLKLAALGLAPGQDRFLLALLPQTRLTITALADDLSVRPSTISKTADRLVAKGLITCLCDDSDARRIFVELTPKGMALCAQVLAIGEEIDAELTANLMPGEASTMRSSLSLLEETAQRRLRRLR